jgi:hypothetical protein
VEGSNLDEDDHYDGCDYHGCGSHRGDDFRLAAQQTRYPVDSLNTRNAASGEYYHALSISMDPNSPTGLRLDLNLSAPSNGTLSITVDESNTLDQANNVFTSDDWPPHASGLFQWTSTICDVSERDLPMGYEVLQGNCGQNNFTDGSPLWLEAQVILPSCALTAPFPPVSYTFKPLSDVASDVNEAVSVSGRWSGFWIGSNGSGLGEAHGGGCRGSPPLNSFNACSLTLDPFAPGDYTVVAADEWGRAVILHFTVQG